MSKRWQYANFLVNYPINSYRHNSIYVTIVVFILEDDQSKREKVEVKVDGRAPTATVKLENVTRGQSLRCCLHMTAVHLHQALWGVAMVICICLSWSGSTQLAKITVRRLNVPFALTWFSTSWNCVVFPLYYLGYLCCSKDRQTPRQRFRWVGLGFISSRREGDWDLIASVSNKMFYCIPEWEFLV